MYFVTSDPHGNFNHILRYIGKYQPIHNDDTVIILGDTGLNYFGDERDDFWKKKLADTGVTFFCIHGNHENRPENIQSYAPMIWNGGMVYAEKAYPNILFAKDGQFYGIDGYRALVCGGAYSVDKEHRLENGWNWWPDEQPSEFTKRAIEANLEHEGWKTDLVLTHTCPLKYEPIEMFLSYVDQSKVDKRTEQWLDKIEDKLEYRMWLCGHFHTNKSIGKIRFLYRDILSLDDIMRND